MAGSVLFVRWAVLLRLVPALARVVVLVVVPAFLMGPVALLVLRTVGIRAAMTLQRDVTKTGA